jgi:hypothetical protein
MAILVQSNKKPNLTFPTLTGSIVTFNSQYAGLPLKAHKIALTATQSGSGTPSPSNPRPISGYSAINISHSGVDTSTPTVYVINLGGTYYGGGYDARTGVLTVTHLIKTINDLTGFDSMSSPSNHVFRAKANDLVGLEYVSGNVPTNAICSHFDAKAWGPISAMDNGKFAIAPLDDGKIVFIAHDYSTVSDFLTDLGTAQIAYPLATPTTIQLPPCPIDTLQGINNIWADTGETTASIIKIGG